MKSSNDSFTENNYFSHIYVEQQVIETKQAQNILEKFPRAQVIPIGHYKDVFNRRNQNFQAQKRSRNLILARKTGNLIYQGAPVCQNFGNAVFFYTSCLMNCIYNCEYCYLQGMYPSANLVAFLNLEDIFREVELHLAENPVYLCVSYDTDLLAMESMFFYVRKWACFAEQNHHLTIEIRTKCAVIRAWDHLLPLDNMIYAFTLSPDEVIRYYEKKASSLMQRIACINELIKRGYQVRLCFDPMLYRKDFKVVYGQFFKMVKEQISWNGIRDISIGLFRISEGYLKVMRRQMPMSAVIQFPYVNQEGVYGYSSEIASEMMNFAQEQLKNVISSDRIFIWDGQQEKTPDQTR